MRFTVSFTVYDVSELRTPNMAPADVVRSCWNAGRSWWWLGPQEGNILQT